VTKPIAIVDPHWRRLDELFDAADLAALGELCELVWARDEPMPRSVLDENLSRTSFLIAARPQLSADEIGRAAQLRAVVEVSGAFPDSLDYAACFGGGIEVLSCAPGFRESVAEMAVGLALAGARGIVEEHEAFRLGQERWLSDNAATDFTLFEATIGFVGLGSIARETLRLIAPFRPNVLAYDPWVDASVAHELGVILRPLDEVMARSRCVFVAAAPTRENKGLVGVNEIALMPSGALLVLISRSHLVDFDALIRAAKEGRIRVATDVFPEEPVAPSSAVRSVRNLILSPHRAAAVNGGRQLIGRMILDDVRLMLAGEAPRHLQRAMPSRIDQLAGVQRAGNITAIVGGAAEAR
jgi:phosphoglycerate dehydrogenase-like enzyme